MVPVTDDRLLVGLDTSDDAAVYQIDDSRAIVQTLDFFTPIVDDPYTFGAIAAANSLSDVYAMGGVPLTAMNIVCFPNCLEPWVLTEILRGGADKMKEAECLLVGGHTVEDDEPKYGLSVLGMVHPDKVWKNSSAKPGDVLVLTKPLGAGILNTALKGGIVTPQDEEYTHVTECMGHLNKYAAEKLMDFTVHAVTDITGFGLLGHAFEMAEGSFCTLEIAANRVPVITKAKEYAQMGLVPAGAYANRKYAGDAVYAEGVSDTTMDLLYDPQTSGGLLISMPQDDALRFIDAMKEETFPAVQIGQVTEKQTDFIKVQGEI